MDTTKPRLYFIDNLRWLMIIFVVLMHVNVTYSMIGGWYYIEKARLDIFEQIYFGMYGSFTQAYFMGFLFFIAGYFVPSSYDRKGSGQFVKERLIRLGIPTLLYMLVIHPLTIAIMNHYMHWNMDFGAWYVELIRTFKFIGESGPLWFAFALLIFSLVYALVRKVACGSKKAEQKTGTVTSKQILAVALFIAVFAFVLRWVFPIGTSVMNMQFCFFAQYIVLFILGTFFLRNNLLQTLSYKLGMNWFKYTLIFGIIFWFIMMTVFVDRTKGVEVISGHGSWQSAAYALWESFMCVGICVGLIVWFREKFNAQGRVSKFLSDNAFGVYVFHTPILVFVSMLFKDVALYPFFKYLVVAVITIPSCFVASFLLRKIPGVGYIIK